MDMDKDIDERIKALEDEFQATKVELNQILLDIRSRLMEAQTPLRTDMAVDRFSEQNEVEKEV